MDVVRSRAIPALIAAAFSANAAALECGALEGTYQFNSIAPAAGESPDTLAGFASGKGRDKLYRVDAPGSKGALSPGRPIQRPRTTPLAVKATLKRSAKGTAFVFLDATGTTLVELSIDDAKPWTCRGDHLERRSERMAGLGDSIRTERIDEVIERNAAGDLVHRETVTVLDPKGIKPSVREARFPSAR